MSQFCKETLENAMHHGVSFILTDYTALPEGGFANRAQELAAGGRPYWVNVTAPMVLAINSELMDGKEQLNLFKWENEVAVLDTDGINYVATREVRTFRRTKEGRVTFLVERLSKGDWIETSKGTLPSKLNSIPITCVYANRDGFYLGQPVFKALAELNVQHYQKRSDLENILHIANVPFLFGKGLSNPGPSTIDGRPAGAKPSRPAANTPEPTLEVDIHNAILTSNATADLGWVEHNGTAITCALDDIKRLEDRMRTLGAALFTSQQTGGTTATAHAINSAEANARLKSIALALQDCIEMALVYVSAYYAVELAPTSKLTVNTSYSIDFVADATYPLVQSLYDIGAIGWDVLIDEAKRRNILALDADVKQPNNPNTKVTQLAGSPELAVVDLTAPGSSGAVNTASTV
jgi:hypothetical protein